MDFGETCDLASVLPLIFSHFLSNWEGGGKKEGIKEKEMQQTWQLGSPESSLLLPIRTLDRLLQVTVPNRNEKLPFSPPCKANLFMNQGYYQSSHQCGEREQTSTFTLLTLGYGYCFPLGYKAPVNRGITMLGTNESFIIRKASLSPSGDHQWAM